MEIAVCIGWKGQYSILNTLKGRRFLPEKLEIGKIYEFDGISAKETTLEQLITQIEQNFSFSFNLPNDLMPFHQSFKTMSIWIKTLSLFPNVIVHFHNDADGISSAILLHKILRHALFFAHPSAVYTMQEAISDVAQANSFNKFLVFLDCGSNDESIHAITFLKKNGFRIFSIDHHACSEDIAKEFHSYLNPFVIKQGALISGKHNYPTGYLMYKLVEAMGMKGEEMAKIACAGDHADVLDVDEEAKQKALALDFAAFYQHKKASINFYERILREKELWTTFYAKADEQLHEAKEKAKELVKKRMKNNILFMRVNLDKVVRDYEFPNRAKITTALLIEEKHSPAVCIGIGKRRIIIRSKGSVHILPAIEKVKENYAKHVKSGGGHEQAASLAVEEGFEETIANAIEEGIA